MIPETTMAAKVPDREYWFERKRYGYGWVPISWQGWSVAVLYGIALAALLFAAPNHWVRVSGIIIASVAAVVVSNSKSSPREN
jgi:hypothetical protein